VNAASGEGRKAGAAGPCGGARWTGVRHWEARRGEHEGEAFGVELAEVIGEREGGARGRGKLQHGRNPRVVHGSQKTMAPAAAAVQTGNSRSETDPGSVTTALGRAQFGAHLFFQLFKLSSNFVIEICYLPEF
jgi:hypothetical protein